MSNEWELVYIEDNHDTISSGLGSCFGQFFVTPQSQSTCTIEVCSAVIVIKGYSVVIQSQRMHQVNRFLKDEKTLITR